MSDILETFDDLDESVRLKLLDQAEAVVPMKFAKPLSESKLKPIAPSAALDAASRLFANFVSSDPESMDSPVEGQVPISRVAPPPVKRKALELSAPGESPRAPAPGELVDRLFKLRKTKGTLLENRQNAQKNYVEFMAQESARISTASPEYAAKSLEESVHVTSSYKEAVKAVADMDEEISKQEKVVQASLKSFEEECLNADLKAKSLAEQLERAVEEAEHAKTYLTMLKKEFLSIPDASQTQRKPEPKPEPKAEPKAEQPELTAEAKPDAEPEAEVKPEPEPTPVKPTAPTQQLMSPTQAVAVFSPIQLSPPRLSNPFPLNMDILSPGLKMSE
jgi:hypothetical protein